MPGVTITKNVLGTIARTMRPLASQVIRKTGFDLVAIEQSLSRVDEGAMKAGWTFESTDDLHGVNYNPVEYTIHHEYGTYKMTAQPMLHPAVDRVRPGYMAAIKQLVERSGG